MILELMNFSYWQNREQKCRVCLFPVQLVFLVVLLSPRLAWSALVFGQVGRNKCRVILLAHSFGASPQMSAPKREHTKWAQREGPLPELRGGQYEALNGNLEANCRRANLANFGPNWRAKL